MTDTPALRKARGAFFTPPALADFLANWAVRSSTDRILEPSCGEAVFLLSAARRLRELGGSGDPERLHGIELHEPSAAAALEALRANGANGQVTVGDFLAQPARPIYTCGLGNPPYLRYQNYSGDNRATGQRAALAAGVRLTGLASAWAPFVIHAAEHLAPGGRLGLVLPAELLSVSYAAGVRQYLLRRFGDVRLVLFEERVFPGVMEEVVLLLAEGEGPTDHFKLHQVRTADDLTSPDQLTWVTASAETDAKWSPSVLDERCLEAFRRLTDGAAFTHLGEGWGKTSLGAVTGNNKWFTMSEARAQDLGLPRKELLPISPPGSRHLRGLTFTTGAWRALADEGRPVYLFYPTDDEPSEAAQRFIAAGEAAGVHRAYKCRVRNPWWRVPLAKTPDVFLTYMNHVAPQMTANRARARNVNSIHGVTLHAGKRRLGQDLLPLAALNSASLLGAEMVGRAYGGGMLKLEPREADRWPMPTPDLVKRCSDDLRALRPQLAALLRRGDLPGVARKVDRVLLRAAGVGAADLKLLREGREQLFARRKSRGGS